MRDATCIASAEADKILAVTVCDRFDYLYKVQKQLEYSVVYEKVESSVVSQLIQTIQGHLTRIKSRRDLENVVLDSFINKNPRIGRYCLRSKKHKRLGVILERPDISDYS